MRDLGGDVGSLDETCVHKIPARGHPAILQDQSRYEYVNVLVTCVVHTHPQHHRIQGTEHVTNTSKGSKSAWKHIVFVVLVQGGA